jgi:lauroyl/myristoyl acyltransferase
VSLRTARRWVTETSLIAARSAAPLIPSMFLRVGEGLIAAAGPHAPRLAAIVRGNMTAAGVYDREVFRGYFRHVGRHLSNAMRMLGAPSRPEEVAAMAREQIDVDESIRHLRDAVGAGRGAVVAAPHVCNYVLTLVRLRMEIPIWVYLRWSKNERKRRLKQAWCEAAGLPVIVEPPDAANPTARAAACVAALQQGKALVMTPDIAQKDKDRGIGVEVLGHRAMLPTGPASIAMLAEAPIVSVFGRTDGPRHTITAMPGIGVPSVSRADGGRREALRRALQVWADGFTSFVRQSPAAWFLWADSRWTRVFRGDARFGGPVLGRTREGRSVAMTEALPEFQR